MRRATALVLLAASGCASPPPGPGPARTYVESIPDSTLKFEMVYVPGPKPFWIGKCEVTWDEYLLYHVAPPHPNDGFARPSPPYEPPDHNMGMGRKPATSLRLHAAETYCAWLAKRTGKAYRLPTEEEWERAAGETPAAIGDHAWFARNSGETAHDVGTRRPNALGIHDMLGNSWEYVAGGDVPVLRGGSWNDAEVRRESRIVLPDEWSERDPQRPKSKWWLTDGQAAGFRVARSAE